MFKLSEEGRKKVLAELARYEVKDSAIIPSLFLAQKENKGWINDEVIEHLSSLMDIPVARINEVFKFYTMFNQKPVGRYHVQVCTNISCALNGSRELYGHLLHGIGVKPGEVSTDGRFTITAVECLGSCGTAPMMQVNDANYENLTPDSAMTVLRGLK
jgi:NADH-quinone oxidoreductase subunit E